MIIKITNNCRMGCSHCFQNSIPGDDMHMDVATFKNSIRLANMLDTKVLMISGGEPTDHPQYERFIKIAKDNYHGMIIVLSNGMFIEENPTLIELVNYQITNDKKYYPKSIKVVEHPNLYYFDSVRKIEPYGRAKGKFEGTFSSGPNCFNFRTMFRERLDMKKALRMTQMVLHKFCNILVEWNGDIKLSEIGCCEVIGKVVNANIESLNEHMMNSDIRKCNNCDKIKLLNPIHLAQLEKITVAD